ncbi:GDP-L-fucose synthase [Hepatocystis sp. ex Piliocolobus tephrosceles]|uniref:GDP-L-fucose synthase-like n=2 Tax=Piliocolobus tephrosceles TaxID=591936 RepID=A0A8C9IGN4_9PRIM|nr:GDP-L-fucose synthase [Hepatocystis sp. ex Piliocolobus tephrosceles]
MSRVCLVTCDTGLLGTSFRETVKKENVDFIENENEIIVNSNDSNVIKKYIFLSSKICDLRNFNDAEIFFKNNKITDIIHFTAYTDNLNTNINNNLEFVIKNLEINLNIIKLCHKYTIARGFFALPICVFPEKFNSPLAEDSIHEELCHLSNEGYSVSKRVLELMVRFYREKYNYEWVCIIPTNIYGKYDNFNLENSHIIPYIIHKMYLAKVHNINVKLMSDGTTANHFIYNSDVCKILYYILNTYYSEHLTIIKDDTFNIIFSTNIPSNELTIKELANKIKHYLGFNNEILFDTREESVIHKKTCNNKLMKILDMSFVFTNIDKGLKETIDWFLEEYRNIIE